MLDLNGASSRGACNSKSREGNLVSVRFLPPAPRKIKGIAKTSRIAKNTTMRETPCTWNTYGHPNTRNCQRFSMRSLRTSESTNTRLSLFLERTWGSRITPGPHVHILPFQLPDLALAPAGVVVK